MIQNRIEIKIFEFFVEIKALQMIQNRIEIKI